MSDHNYRNRGAGPQQRGLSVQELKALTAARVAQGRIATNVPIPGFTPGAPGDVLNYQQSAFIPHEARGKGQQHPAMKGHMKPNLANTRSYAQQVHVTPSTAQYATSKVVRPVVHPQGAPFIEKKAGHDGNAPSALHQGLSVQELKELTRMRLEREFLEKQSPALLSSIEPQGYSTASVRHELMPQPPPQLLRPQQNLSQHQQLHPQILYPPGVGQQFLPAMGNPNRPNFPAPPPANFEPGQYEEYYEKGESSDSKESDATSADESFSMVHQHNQPHYPYPNVVDGRLQSNPPNMEGMPPYPGAPHMYGHYNPIDEKAHNFHHGGNVRYDSSPSLSPPPVPYHHPRDTNFEHNPLSHHRVDQQHQGSEQMQYPGHMLSQPNISGDYHQQNQQAYPPAYFGNNAGIDAKQPERILMRDSDFVDQNFNAGYYPNMDPHTRVVASPNPEAAYARHRDTSDIRSTDTLRKLSVTNGSVRDQSNVGMDFHMQQQHQRNMPEVIFSTYDLQRDQMSPQMQSAPHPSNPQLEPGTQQFSNYVLPTQHTQVVNDLASDPALAGTSNVSGLISPRNGDYQTEASLLSSNFSNFTNIPSDAPPDSPKSLRGRPKLAVNCPESVRTRSLSDANDTSVGWEMAESVLGAPSSPGNASSLNSKFLSRILSMGLSDRDASGSASSSVSGGRSRDRKGSDDSDSLLSMIGSQLTGSNSSRGGRERRDSLDSSESSVLAFPTSIAEAVVSGGLSSADVRSVTGLNPSAQLLMHGKTAMVSYHHQQDQYQLEFLQQQNFAGQNWLPSVTNGQNFDSLEDEKNFQRDAFDSEVTDSISTSDTIDDPYIFNFEHSSTTQSQNQHK